jgi:hypothetical protein
MKYKHAFTFLFSRPNWTKELLLMAVCVLIPIVGVLVLLGYRSELLDEWLDGKDDLQVQGFDFNRFSQQLTRGLWPFLYQLIVGMVIGLFAFVLYFVTIISMMATKEVAVFLLGMLLFMLSMMVIQTIAHAILWPFVTHGQITGKFDFGGAWSFAKDYYQRLGFFNLIVTALTYVVISFPIAIVGYICCLIGLYPAIAIINMADGNLIYQLYQRYLERGGEPLPRFVPDEPKPHSSDSHSEPEAT